MGTLNEYYDTIEAHPFGYHVRKGDFRHALLRKFPFRVVYEVDGSEVIIYRVVHMRRRPHERFGP